MAAENANVRKIERENSKNQWKVDLKWAMSEPSGRRLFWRLISDRGGMFRDVMASNDRTTEYMLGRRAMAVEMFDELGNECPDERALMVGENMEGF